MIRDAYISDCRKYRWWLTRIWDPALPILAFVMLNPSTANAETDDPTIRRCIGFARRDGYGGICVFNLYAFRATNPKSLTAAAAAAAAANDFTERLVTEQWLAYAATHFGRIVCAWGCLSNSSRHKRVSSTMPILRESTQTRLLCLGRTTSGEPRHPLYVRKDQPLLPF